MKIYINDKKTSYELENEKNSYDVITAISDYAAKSKPQHFITNIIIDNKEYSFADEAKLKGLNITKIKEIKIETGDVYGITSLSIEQMDKFIKLLRDIFISRKFDEILTNIDDSLSWMKEGLNQIIRIFDPKEEFIAKEKDVFFTNTDILSKLLKEKQPKEIFEDENILKKIIKSIDLLTKSIEDIKKWLIYSYRLPDRNFVLNSISKIIMQIDEIIPQLENVPVLFQTGDDKEAMDVIQRLTDILEESIGLFVLFKESFQLHMDKYTVKEVQFESFFKAMTDHLKELMESIKNGDSVMVGDLLEYEFVPNIEEIKKILIKIKEEAFVKAN